jgi:(1->4)-alpha-D-glucan 1-alpha-D-glucosylmutase
MTSPSVPDFYQGSELWDLNLVDPDNRRPVNYAARQKILSDLKKKFEAVQGDGREFFSALLRDENSPKNSRIESLNQSAPATSPPSPPRSGGEGRGEVVLRVHGEDAGAMKLFLIWRALNFRRAQRELFDRGDYTPLSTVGEKQDHLCAFAREWNAKKMIVVVPRLVFGLTRGAEVPPIGEIWKDTVLILPQSRAGNSFRNVLTGETAAAIEHKGNAALEIAQVLKSFPVALLEKI